MVVGLALCIAGASLLVGSSWGIAPERLIGDLCGLATSVFFGMYFLAVRVARREAMSGLIVLRSTAITAAALAIAALVMERAWVPTSVAGAASLIALAIVSHTGGQGLLAYALGHLSAAFSSLVIFLEALFAAFFAWLLFHEALQPLQYAGGIAILAMAGSIASTGPKAHADVKRPGFRGLSECLPSAGAVTWLT
eukprot:gene19665-20125_t